MIIILLAIAVSLAGLLCYRIFSGKKRKHSGPALDLYRADTYRVKKEDSVDPKISPAKGFRGWLFEEERREEPQDQPVIIIIGSTSIRRWPMK